MIADPTGHLTALKTRIAPSFATAAATESRCQDVLGRIRARTASLDASAPWHQQVTAWMFPTSLTTQVPLVAALRPPTVRLRYLRAREVLAAHGRDDVYDHLLGLLGCAGVEPAAVQHHLEALAVTFDTAAALARTRFEYSADIAPPARAAAIDGSRRLVDDGNHREAVFWVIATASRCQSVVDVDAPAPLARLASDRFTAATGDLLGLRSTADLHQRTRRLPCPSPRLADHGR